METHQTYEMLDQPGVVEYLFHPRRTSAGRITDPLRQDMMIPVAPGIALGASLHFKDERAPVLLFFHGNGEIVEDYDDLGPAFARRAGVNFWIVDYRGYGDSGGVAGVGAMMADAHKVLGFVTRFLKEQNLSGPVSVMGRSLGSAPALELAQAYPDACHSLIVESGFAYAGPLLKVLGLNPDRMGFREEKGMGNLEKMGRVTCPCLVIHAQRDVLIPFSDGQALYDRCSSPEKELLEIKGAGHNDIFLLGMGPYLDGVKRFCARQGP